MSALNINGNRLWQSLDDMAQVGPGVAGGNCRLALTEEDKAGRDLFIRWAEAAGLQVRVDELGNIFARRAGQDDSAAPVLVGSHLDTQPTGGRYDGVYGVLSGLEVLRTLNDNGIETLRPMEVVVWTNEEGSRFHPAMNGSGVFSGALEKQASYDQISVDGHRFEDDLKKIGYKGTHPCAAFPIHAYVEAHIEQGPILEREQNIVGVVSGIQGMKWFKLRLEGMNSHAGTTPMVVRRDAMVGAARIVDQIDRLTRQHNPKAVSTVGMMEVSPCSMNVINSEARFSLDLRCPVAEDLFFLEGEIRKMAEQTAKEMNLVLRFEEIWYSPPTLFAPEIVDNVEAQAQAMGFSHQRIVSGAGHDAKYLADICPTAMIFIPCKDGISHNEAEDVEPEHATAGAAVLLNTLVALANQP